MILNNKRCVAAITTVVPTLADLKDEGFMSQQCLLYGKQPAVGHVHSIANKGSAALAAI
jgi:hypothetical protein